MGLLAREFAGRCYQDRLLEVLKKLSGYSYSVVLTSKYVGFRVEARGANCVGCECKQTPS